VNEPYGNPTLRGQTSLRYIFGIDTDRYSPNRQAESAKREPYPAANVRTQRIVGFDVAYPYFQPHATSVTPQSVDVLFVRSARFSNQ